MASLLTCSEVKTLMKRKNIRFFDASWYLDKTRSPADEFQKEHLPSAVRFDIDRISDQDSPLPHMLPSVPTFQAFMTEFGLTPTDSVVVYGGENCFSAARCWWMLKHFGHQDVAILNGGLLQWKHENGPIESGEAVAVNVSQSNYIANPQPNLVVDADQVLTYVENSSDVQILDARSKSRFNGEEPEPREGVRSGHIPNSINVHYAQLVASDNAATFRPISEMKQVFTDAGVDLTKSSQIVTSCGSGVTAALLTFSLHLCGMPLDKLAVYDGSWTEWGSISTFPLEK